MHINCLLLSLSSKDVEKQLDYFSKAWHAASLSPPKQLWRVLPVLQCSKSAYVPPPRLSEPPAELPHFLSRPHTLAQGTAKGILVRFYFLSKLCVCKKKSHRDTHIHTVDPAPLSHLQSVLSFPAPHRPLLFLSSSVGGKLSLHRRLHPCKLHTSQAPFFSFPATFTHFICPSISFQRQTKPLFGIHPFPLSKQDYPPPRCQTGSSDVHITASCFENLSFQRLYCNAHSRTSGPSGIAERQWLLSILFAFVCY